MFDLIGVSSGERFGALVLGTSIYDAVETLKDYRYQGQPVPLYSINPLPVGKPASFIKLAMDE